MIGESRFKPATQIKLSVLLSLFALIATIVSTLQYTESLEKLRILSEQRQEALILADHLRQTSDDLTRMVRTYVATRDPAYKEHFQRILDIRNGNSPRPEKIGRVYWDLITGGVLNPQPLATPVALVDLMRQVGIKQSELALLENSQAASDLLTETEFIAMSLIELDTSADAAEEALLLLHDQNYHAAKAKIMQSIATFDDTVSNRINKEIQAMKTEEELSLRMIAFSGVLLILFFGASVWGYMLIGVQQREALQRQANRTKDEFLASMSHELRTPLTSILGNGDLLAERLKLAENREILGSITRSGEHLLAMVNDILDLAKIEAGKFEVDRAPYDLEEVLDQIRQMFRNKATVSGIELSVEQSVNARHKLVGDSKRIGQILLNLVSNAFKFTENGYVAIRCWREEDTLYFSVKDSGIGMSQEVLDRLFQPFEQADSSISRRFGGTGLGLHISWSLAQLMGGKIDVSSQEGKGSHFVFSMPYIESGQPLIAEQTESRLDERGLEKLSGHILIAEDTLELQLLESRMVQSLGDIRITFAENGIEAVSLSEQQPFDLILMDMQMPEMNGLEATRVIKERGDQTPIVAVTANVMQKHKEQFSEVGADGFLEKPLNRESLEKVLRMHLTVDHSEPQAAEQKQKIEFSVDKVPILVVDDNAGVLKTFREIFESDPAIEDQFPELTRQVDNDSGQSEDDFQLVTASQGEQGVELVQQALEVGAPFPVVFLDIRMPPGMGGLETAKQMRELDERVHIVFVSAYSDVSFKQIKEEVGDGVLFFEKPFRADEVMQAAATLADIWRKMYRHDALESETAAVSNVTGAQYESGVELDMEIDDELLDLYRDSTRQRKERLIAAVETENWSEIRSVAHVVKGAGASFGFQHHTNLGRELQDLIDHSQYDSAVSKARQLIDEMEKIGA